MKSQDCWNPFVFFILDKVLAASPILEPRSHLQTCLQLKSTQNWQLAKSHMSRFVHIAKLQCHPPSIFKRKQLNNDPSLTIKNNTVHYISGEKDQSRWVFYLKYILIDLFNSNHEFLIMKQLL